MYGHANDVLTMCVRCPGWAPEYAKVINDNNEPVCRKHAVETCADFKEK